MLHDRGQGNRERLRQFAYRKAFAFPEPGQQRAPSWVRERGKGAIEALVGGVVVILNHLV